MNCCFMQHDLKFSEIHYGRKIKDFSFYYYIGNCAQNVRIFACKIKVHLFIPQEWGNEGVEVLKHFFIIRFASQIHHNARSANHAVSNS